MSECSATETIDVAGLRLHVRRAGQLGRLPAIVLEAGAGASSACWGWVQRGLAARTLVLSYDRAGLGGSHAAPDDVGADATASRLDALLAASGIPAPHILVGHSLGGAYAQCYAARHASSIAGLVLVDPTPFDPSLILPRYDRAAVLYFALLRLLKALAWTGAFHLYNPFRLIAKRSRLPATEREEVIAAFASSHHLGTVIRELKAIDSIRWAANQCPVPTHIPVLVVTAGVRSRPFSKIQGAVARFYDHVRQNHRAMAACSAAGSHITIDKADHNSLLSEREFAEELANHILRFAEECCSTPVRAQSGAS